MRKMLIGILLPGFLALTACGGQPAPEYAEPLPEDGVCGLMEAPPGQGGWLIDMEREIFDPSLTTFTYFIRNNTGETAEFGEDYRIRRLEGEEWVDLTPREGWGFNCIGFILEHDGEIALTCTLDRYEEPPEPGSYQLVKPVGSATLYAEFRLGRSPCTAEAPYGFGPLEDLPEDYCAYTASKDCVVFTGSGMRNPEGVEEFLHKSGLSVPCQLRTVQDCGGGTPVIIDVIYENSRFLRRMRSGGAVAEQYFSYIVTDGRDIYLSNGADWASGEKYHDSRTPLIPEGASAGMIAAVEDMTESRLAGSSIRYQIWSADGRRRAFLTETGSPTEFTVNGQEPDGGVWSGVYDLQNWDGTETAITGISWQGDGRTLLLSCKTAERGTSTLIFDSGTEHLTALAICGLPPVEELQ